MGVVMAIIKRTGQSGWNICHVTKLDADLCTDGCNFTPWCASVDDPIGSKFYEKFISPTIYLKIGIATFG